VCGFRTYGGKKFDTITNNLMGHCWIEEWTKYGWYVVETTFAENEIIIFRYSRNNYYKQNGINPKTTYGLALFKYSEQKWGIKLYYKNFKKLRCGKSLIAMKEEWNKKMVGKQKFFNFIIP